MLRLESIVLQGFKSFVDRTRLTFPLGITCIVGPNGCGKSNIADAIAWVLGEQSPKSLRGEKMGDIIFAGSPTRGASGHADVSMTWVKDHVDRASAEKVAHRLEVSRRLFRNGDSEYILNGKACRLKDVQSALLDFGMGTKTYSIIEQGKVGQILSSKPTERRQLLEEAAGILKYKMRRHESQLKLRSAEENLQRLQDILSEIQKQRSYLKRQVGKARRYKLLKERLREIDRQVLTFEIVHFTEKHIKLQSEYRQLNAEEQAASKKLLEFEETLRKKRALCVKDEEEHKQLIRNTNETAKEIERLKQKILFFTDKVKERNLNLHSIQEEKVKGREHKKGLEEDLALCEQDLGHVQETLKQQKLELERLFEKLASEKKRLESEGKQEEQLRSDLEGMKKRLHGLEIENTQIIRQKSLLESQLEEFHRGKKELEHEIQALSEQRETEEKKLQSSENKLVQLQAERKSLEQQADLLNKNKETVTAQMRQQEKELHQIVNQRTNLESLFKQRQDLSDSVRWVLQKGQGKIHILRDFLDSNHQYDSEVETLLGDLAQAFLIGADADADLLDPLIQTKPVYCLDLRTAPRTDLLLEIPDEIVDKVVPLDQALWISDDCPADIKENLGKSIRALCRTKVILKTDQDKFPTPRHLSMMFPYLEVVQPGVLGVFQANLVKGISKSEKSKGFLTLKGEISKLNQKEILVEALLKETSHNVEIASLASQESLKKLQESHQTVNQLDKDCEKLRTHISHCNNQIQQFQARQSREERLAAQLVESRKQIQNRTESIEKERVSLDSAIQVLNADYQAKSIQAKAIREQVQEQFNQEARLKEKIDSAGVLKHRIEEEHAQLKSMFRNLVQNEENRIQQTQVIQTELVEFEESLVQQQVRLKDFQKRLETEEFRGQKMEQALSRLREEIEIQANYLGDSRDKRDDMRAKQGRFELEQARIQSELTHLKESYVLSQNETFSSAGKEDLLAEDKIDAYKKERAEIKRNLSELGTVNLLAVEEYDDVETRYEFLINQQKDLVDAIAEIRSTIRTLNKESVARFKTAFEEINKLFQDNFVALFGGGQARLEMLDEENVLDSGIDMIIQPPGKKLQNAMLMSGGEKALTATALLFSIFEYRPSPFCLLDEVDAPLDEANVMRLTKKLEKMKQQTQFIMITHHKSTMAIASSLFGVTMEENGCSKIVSVNFS